MLIQSFWSGTQKSAFSVGPRRSDAGDSGHTGPDADSRRPCPAAGEAILDEELETWVQVLTLLLRSYRTRGKSSDLSGSLSFFVKEGD